jgi:hypothetical protein
VDKNQRKNIRPLSAGNNNSCDGEFSECTSKNAIKSTQFHKKLEYYRALTCKNCHAIA